MGGLQDRSRIRGLPGVPASGRREGLSGPQPGHGAPRAQEAHRRLFRIAVTLYMVVLASRQPFQRRVFPTSLSSPGHGRVNLWRGRLRSCAKICTSFSASLAKFFRFCWRCKASCADQGNTRNIVRPTTPSVFFFVFLIGTHVDLGQNYSSVGGEALKMKNASMREISGNILKREISLEIGNVLTVKIFRTLHICHIATSAFK